MKRKINKVFAIILAVTILASSFAFLANAYTMNEIEITNQDFKDGEIYSYITNQNIDPDNLSNSVVIPGVFQSRTLLYNEDGTVALTADGEEKSGPFYLDSTGETVKYAVKKLLFPLLLTLFTQHDWNDMLANRFGEGLGYLLGENIKSDSNGKFVHNIKADKYNDCVANLTDEQKDYIYSQIPLNDYSELVGEDHLYFFSYASFGNINDIVDELYEFIIKAAKASPTGKANIIPISQGGSLSVDLLDRHPDIGKYLDRIIYIVPALDGTVLLGEIFSDGIIDDDNSLYNEILPILLYDDDQPWMGYLVNVVLRILPKKVINNMLDKAVESLIGDYIKNSTCMWALTSSKDYKKAADKYLNGEDNKVIRSQTDAFNKAQLKNNENIKYQINNYGVKVFDIVDYNYSLYPIVDSWKELNGDGVIHLSSTSMGATSAPVNGKLPDNYIPAKSDKYIDKYRIVDAGSGLLPDTSFYFHNQNHESTARNDIVMKLATSLLSDNNFVSIDSYPDKYPQFNEARDGKGLAENVKFLRNEFSKGEFKDVDPQKVEELLARGKKISSSTVMDPEKFDKEKEKFYYDRDELLYGIEHKEEKVTLKDKIETKSSESFGEFIKSLSDILYKYLGGKGFSDVFRIEF